MYVLVCRCELVCMRERFVSICLVVCSCVCVYMSFNLLLNPECDYEYL